MFRRKKKQSLPRRIVKRIREYYLYCKVYVAEKVAARIAREYQDEANKMLDRPNTSWFKDIGKRFKLRSQFVKFMTQAAICRYARRSGTYKNL